MHPELWFPGVTRNCVFRKDPELQVPGVIRNSATPESTRTSSLVADGNSRYPESHGNLGSWSEPRLTESHIKTCYRCHSGFPESPGIPSSRSHRNFGFPESPGTPCFRSQQEHGKTGSRSHPEQPVPGFTRGSQSWPELRVPKLTRKFGLPESPGTKNNGFPNSPGTPGSLSHSGFPE